MCYFIDDTCILTQSLICQIEFQSDMTEVGFDAKKQTKVFVYLVIPQL